MRLRLSQQALFERPGQAALPLAARDAALLAWLALEGPTPRARLAQLLWPERAEDSARNSLRQRLFQLKRQLGVDLVQGGPLLQLAEAVAHDLAEAETLLPGLAPAIGGEFDAWLARERQRLGRRRREQRLQQLQAAEDARDAPQALALAQDWLAAEPLLEEAHRRVMRAHYLLGDRAAALRAYEHCVQVLATQLGAAPAPETQALKAGLDSGQLSTPGSALAPLAVLRPPRLVGREAEIEASHQAWAQGRGVALVADAGMGKSRLLQHLLPPGAVLVSARPGDANVPMATLARLLRAVLERQAQPPAPALRSELARVLPEWAEAAPPPGLGDRLALQQAVRTLLWHTPGQPVLALDDLHFADSASLQLLQALLDDDSAAASPQRWALAYRPAEAASQLQGLQAVLLDHARMQPVALRPLDAPALAALVDSLGLPGIDGNALAPVLLQRTGGNPLFLLETLKQAWAEQRLAGLADVHTAPRPPSVLRLIQRRIGQLSPLALALARCAAVAGQDFSTQLASQVLGAPALALADAWAELEAAQILRDQAFVHDLYFEAALGSVPAAIARHLHGDIALHLEGRAAAATLARHWLAAGQPERAAPHLALAAEAATRALDPAEAARLWARLAALRQAAGDMAAALQAQRQHVLALRGLGHGDELAQAIEAFAGLARLPAEQAEAHELRAAMFHARGQAAEAAASLARGLAVLGPGGDPAQRAGLLNMQGVVLRRAGRLPEAGDALRAGVALARQHAMDDLPALLNNLGLVLQDQDDHLAAIALMQEAAERQPEPLQRARVLNNLAISLEERGQVALAREQRLAAARSAQGAGAGGTLAELNLAISLGANARNLGRYRDALAHLAQARSLADSTPHWREEDLQRQYAALWLDLGRFNLAREALQRAVALTQGQHGAAVVAIVRARLALALAQPAEALQLLTTAETALAAGNEQRALRRLWLVKAQALVPEQALPLLLDMTQTAALRDNPAAALPVEVRLAQVLLALAQPAAALRHAQRAATALQAMLPLEMTPAEVWLTLARAALAAGDAELARQAALQGHGWLQQVAREQLDEMYREGWLQRNPVNAQLLMLVARPD